MDRKDFFYKQKLTQAEMDAAWAYAEQGIWNARLDNAIYGVINGLVPTLSGASSVQVTSGIAVDQFGKRVKAFYDGSVNKIQSYATDTAGGATSVTAGNERWISIYAMFGRNALDSRTDGNGATVYFDQPECLHDGTVGVLSTAGLGGAGVDKFLVIAGASNTTGNAVKPTLRTDAILLCDIKRTPSDASNVLDTTRRMVFQILDTTQPGTGNGLAIAMSALSSWLGGRTFPAQASLNATLSKIITDLAATTASDDGAERIGAQASGNLPSGSARSQLDYLDTNKAQLNAANHFTGAGNTQTLDGALSVGGNATVTGTLGITGQTNPTVPNSQTVAAVKPVHASTAAMGTIRLIWEIPGSTTRSNAYRLYAAYNLPSGLSDTGTGEGLMFTIGASWNGTNWSYDGTAGGHPTAIVFPFHLGVGSATDTAGIYVLIREISYDANNLTWANTVGVTTGWTKAIKMGGFAYDSSNVGEARAGTATFQVDTGRWLAIPGTAGASAGFGKTYYLGARGYNTAAARIAGRETLQPAYTATPTNTTLTPESNSNAGSITIDTLAATDIKWSFSVTATGDANSYSRLEIF